MSTGRGAFQGLASRGQMKRRRFITLEHAYHGDTVGAMSASEDSVFTRAFGPLLFPVERVAGLNEIVRGGGFFRPDYFFAPDPPPPLAALIDPLRAAMGRI